MKWFKKLFNHKAKIQQTKETYYTFKVVGFTHAGTPCEMYVTAKNETEARKTAMSCICTDSRAYTTDSTKNWTTKFKGIYYIARKCN